MKVSLKILSIVLLSSIILSACSEDETKVTTQKNETEEKNKEPKNKAEEVKEVNVIEEEVKELTEDYGLFAFYLATATQYEGYTFIDLSEVKETPLQDKILILSTGGASTTEPIDKERFKYNLKSLTDSNGQVTGEVEKVSIPKDASIKKLAGLNITIYKIDESVTEINKITFEDKELKKIPDEINISFSTDLSQSADTEVQLADGIIIVQEGKSTISNISNGSVEFENGKTYSTTRDFSQSFSIGEYVEYQYETDHNNNIKLINMINPEERNKEHNETVTFLERDGFYLVAKSNGNTNYYELEFEQSKTIRELGLKEGDTINITYIEDIDGMNIISINE